MAEITVRNLPDDLVDLLKAEAERTGSTIVDVIELRLRQSLVNSERADWLAKWRELDPVPYGSETIVESVRAERESR